MSHGRVKLEREEQLARFYARDAAWDGRFLVGVLTTGIYCLPSCSARKPKPENVLILEDEGEARGKGLRACKRCRPDHFYRSFDPDREALEELAERVRREPGQFSDLAELASAGGMGASKLSALFRRHYHTTPAAFLLEARLEHAARSLLAPKSKLLDVALDAGFESSSTFHENFRRRMGLSPGAYAKLPQTREFELKLPLGFRPDEVCAMFARPGEAGLSERQSGNRLVKSLGVDGRIGRLEIKLGARTARCRWSSRRTPRTRELAEVHARVLRLLGLGSDPGIFERRATRLGHRSLVRGRLGLRVPLTADPFEGLVWVIVGQQVNLPFAITCRERLIELCGEEAGQGLRAHPAPQAVAELDYGDLQERQFSRRKAEYLIDSAREMVAGRLDLEALATRPVEVQRSELSRVRGLGPWSVDYLLMRSFGREDCVPLGDVALEASLESYFELTERPSKERTAQLMQPFAPHRSLATFHFWKRLGAEA